MRKIGWLSLLVALLLALAACGGDDDDSTGDTGSEGGTPPTVYAAASLTEVFPAIDPAPTYNFAGSDELATQITRGRAGRRLRRGQLEVPAAALRGGARRGAGRRSRPTASC